MVYNFKLWQELGWGILVAILVTLAQALLEFDASAIKDWQVWALGLFSGCIRAVAAILVSSLTGKFIFKT